MKLPSRYPKFSVSSTHMFKSFRITGVVVIDSILPLPAKKSDVFTVDDNDMVSAIRHRMVNGLISTLQHLKLNVMMIYVKKYLLLNVKRTFVIAFADENGFCHFAS